MTSERHSVGEGRKQKTQQEKGRKVRAHGSDWSMKKKMTRKKYKSRREGAIIEEDGFFVWKE